eukprot:scaffold785_cov335-Pavlova_lutheri.AAC.3
MADHVHGIRTGNVSAKPKLPENFEQTTTAKLKDAVAAVHEKRPVNCSLEELYQVRNLHRFRALGLSYASGRSPVNGLQCGGRLVLAQARARSLQHTPGTV